MGLEVMVRNIELILNKKEGDWRMLSRGVRCLDHSDCCVKKLLFSKFLQMTGRVSYSLASAMQESESQNQLSFVIIYHATTTFQHPGNQRMNPRMLPHKIINFHNFASEQGKIKPKIEEDSLYLTSAFQILSKYT